MEFHRVFFRDPRRSFHVLYDSFDQEYWGMYYELTVRPGAEAFPGAIPLGGMPAPIQHSIYLPQSSVWSGYPLMWRMGMHDNLWLRVLTAER
jgi:hypothetical protein